MLIKAHAGESQAEKWLDSQKTEIDASSVSLATHMKVLVEMHMAKLRAMGKDPADALKAKERVASKANATTAGKLATLPKSAKAKARARETKRDNGGKEKAAREEKVRTD